MAVENANFRPTDWVRRFHPAPAAHGRLVCFPHAGGAASYFHGVSGILSPAVEVLAIQYPCRQDRRTEPHARTVDELADRTVSALAPWTDRPLTLFGHSMGALVAFEVARRLTDRGSAPHLLVVSGRRAPSRRREEAVHLLDDAGLLAHVRQLSGKQSDLLDDEELRDLFLPTIRGDYRIVETYRYTPGPRLTCPVLALTGDADPLTTLDEATAWGEHTEGDLELRVYPGGHFFLDDHARTVAQTIRERIGTAVG